MSEKMLPEKRFVVDSMLGKVAKWLRVLGFDAVCERLSQRSQVEAHIGEGRVVVTRNRRWRGEPGVVYPESNEPREQLRDVIREMRLGPGDAHFLDRCMLCNELLRPLSRGEAFGLVPDYIVATSTIFHRCPQCGRVYWKGTHPARIKQRLRELLSWPL